MKADLAKLKLFPVLNYIPHSVLKTVRLVFVGGIVVILVTHENEVLLYGYDNERGLYQNQETMEPVFYDTTNVVKIKEFSKKRIKRFTSNAYDSTLDKEMFVVVLLKTGLVYVFGTDPTKRSICVNFFMEPTLIQGISKRVIKVACGETHFLALTDNGQVYGWGDNSHGQLGYISSRLSEANKAIRVGKNIFDCISHISCGSHFSVAVSEALGIVYAWGKNDKGQLGLNSDIKMVDSPHMVTHLEEANIRRLSCGLNHVLALNEFGEVYSWGCNLKGQLGIEFTDGGPKTYPQKLSTSLRFKKVVASGNLSVGTSISGKIYVWGEANGEVMPFPVLCPCTTTSEVFALFKGRISKAIKVTSLGDSVLETLANSFNNPENADFKIIAEEKEIHLHKSVLKMRSEYFRSMFQEQWTEGKKSCIHMDENFNALFAFLKFLYTDSLEINHPEDALNVDVLADKYLEPNLMKICKQKFECSLNLANVAALYELTLERKMKEFKYLCINFAYHHLGGVIDSDGFRNWSPNTYKTFFSEEKIKLALHK